MSQRLPSLHQLLVFETAARHMSFKRASEELFVTPSSVSHEVKALEEYLGFPLFRRMNRSLQLTDAGASYYQQLEGIFIQLRRATDSLTRTYGRPVLRISLSPFISTGVILCRLEELQSRLPNVEIRIETRAEIQALKSGEVDFMVALDSELRTDVIQEELISIVVSPVCAPEYVQQQAPLTLSELNRHTLIRLRNIKEVWPVWAKNAGLESFHPQKELSFDAYSSCIQAAERGLGLALAIFPLENYLLSAGRLVKPFSNDLEMPGALFLYHRKDDAEREDLQIFRSWLLQQLTEIDTFA